MDDSCSRRRALRAAGVVVTAGVAGCQFGDDSGVEDGDPAGETPATSNARGDGTTPSPTERTVDGTPTGATPGSFSVGARRVAAGFTSPVGIEIPEPGRRFIVDQSGQIYLQDRDGLHDVPFLDVTDRMVSVSGYSERGLLGLAFHPDFGENGRFYVRYSAPPRDGTPPNYSHTFVLSEFEADPGARRADPASERTVMEIPEPQSNHNAGSITFGPDGYLYVGVGDGGGANDQGPGHVKDWYAAVDGGNGQDVDDNLLGSVLRIDVDGREGNRGYAIPDSNPLVGTTGKDEHFAWGFRNPWRMSFGPDGRLFVADVGQNRYEEVSIVEKGGNYGWNVKEGTHCFGANACPSESPDGDPLRDPVIEYPHGGAPVSGISVIGGYLYGGSAIPTLRERYVFADWRAQGRLFVATPREEGLWPLSEIQVESAERFGPYVLSFGRNPAGELFVCTTATGGVSGNTGAVFRLTST